MKIDVLKKTWQEREFRAGTALAVSITFMLFVFAPLELYFNNMQEFWFDLGVLFPLLALLFLSAVLIHMVMDIPLFVYGRKWYGRKLFAEFTLFIILYVQGNFLINRLPSLQGVYIHWHVYRNEYFKSMLLVISVTGAVILAVKKLGTDRMLRVITTVSLFATAVLLTTILSLFFVKQGSEEKLKAVVTYKNMMDVSTDDNYIIMVLDSADAAAFSEMMIDSPLLKDQLKDFTFYKNVMGAYPYTKLSIPFILSGEWFENKQSFSEYNISAYKDSSLLEALEHEGTRLDIYEPEMPLLDESIFRFSNIEMMEGISSFFELAKMEMRLVGFRYMPFGLKQFFVVDMNDFALLQTETEHSKYFFLNSNKRYLDMLREEPFTFSDQKVFKFIHLEGAHRPFQYDKDMNVIDEKDGSYEQQMQASFMIVKEYLNKLKENQLYDNSVLVIMSDHGYGSGDDYERQNPILLVKGRKESHPFEVSDAPVSFVDLEQAFLDLKDGAAGNQIFSWEEGDERERRYLRYAEMKEDYLEEYIQSGAAADEETLYPTGRCFTR